MRKKQVWRWGILGWILVILPLMGFSEEGVSTIASEKTIHVINNGIVRVQYDDGLKTFSVYHRDRCFIQNGTFSSDSDSGIIRILDIWDGFGEGHSIQIDHANGIKDSITLYDHLPFVFTQVSLTNVSSEEQIFETVPAVSVSVDMPIPVSDLRVFGCESIQTLDQKRTSYSFLTVTEPASRASVVCGYLTHLHGSGIVTAESQQDRIKVEARTEYGRLRLAPGDHRDGEILVLGYFNDGLEGLEAYADSIATIHGIHLPPVPSGYCTWYHARASDEQHMAELARFCNINLKDYGFGFMQIDDFWQISTETEKRDFTSYKPDGPYPSGMKATADAVTKNGFTAGLWLIPFAWNPAAPALIDHPDWFMKDKEGKINWVSWAGYCLDNTNPETRKFIAEVISRITRDWGYQYLKLDGLWSGMGTTQLYPTPDYRPDGLGEAILHDPYKTQIEAYRMGLENVREAAGKKVFLLGCNIAQNMRTMGGSFGLLDGMRIGRDIGAQWDHIVPCAALASSLYFFHGRVWYNDPDCLMLRDPLTLDQARAWGSLIGISGVMNVVSEWLPELSPEKMDVFKRTLPNHGLCARPIDLFERSIAQVWHLNIGEENLKRDIVGLFNWDQSASSTILLDLQEIGLPKGRYVGFDFWENRFIAPFSENMEFTLRPSSCHIIALQPAMEFPQLISTSRHITQGGIDLKKIEWDADRNLLSGISSMIGNDPYELRIALPESGEWQMKKATSSIPELPVSFNQSGRELRVLFQPTNTAEVHWQIEFES